MSESQHWAFQEAAASDQGTSQIDGDWIHGLQGIKTLLDYVPNLSQDSTIQSSTARFMDCCVTLRELGSSESRQGQRQGPSSSSRTSGSETQESGDSSFFRSSLISDDYDSAFSGLLHLPSFSFSGDKLSTESVNAHKYLYSNSAKIDEISYIFGGLAVDTDNSLKSMGIPWSTPLSNISVHCSTELPPYMEKALIISPMFVHNRNLIVSNPTRSMVIHVNPDGLESTSPFDVCAMTGTQISDSQIFFCGGFKVIIDKVEFDQQKDRWNIYKSIVLNEDGYIFNIKTFRFSKIKISSNSDTIYKGKLGFSMCSSMVGSVDSGKRVFSNPHSVNTEVLNRRVPISSPGPVYPSEKYKYPEMTSSSPSQGISSSTTPVSAKSPSSTRSAFSVKSPVSKQSSAPSAPSGNPDTVLERESKYSSPVREKFTSVSSVKKERTNSLSQPPSSPEMSPREKEAPANSKVPSSTAKVDPGGSVSQKSQSSATSRPSPESSNASSSSSTTRLPRSKADKFRYKHADKKIEDPDSKSHKFMLAIPGRLFHRNSKHGSGNTSLHSPNTISAKVKSKPSVGSLETEETKSDFVERRVESRETAEKKEYFGKNDISTKRAESKTRVASESENLSTKQQSSTSTIRSTSASEAHTVQKNSSEQSLSEIEVKSKADEFFKSVSQPSSAKDARSESRGSDEVLYSRYSGSDIGVHRRLSMESKTDDEKSSFKYKAGVKREQNFESIEETMKSDIADDTRTNLSSENSKSSISTVCVCIFGGFKAQFDSRGKQTFVATNDLLKLELLFSEPSTLQFHSEAFIISADQETVIPQRRGFFASVVVSVESASNILNRTFTGDNCIFSLSSAKVASKSNYSIQSDRSKSQFNPEHCFDDKCLLVHGGVDENYTTYGDSYLYDFKNNIWVQFETFSYDYYGIPKQPYEDEDFDRLRFETQLENAKYGEAELRACHHQAHIIAEGDLEYLVFVGGYYNDYLRHYEPKPYESDKLDISRLTRLSLAMTNSNLLRMPILNLSTQTWYLKRYFYDFTKYPAPELDEVLNKPSLVNTNAYITGGEISVVGKQIVIHQGQMQIIPCRRENFEAARHAIGMRHILVGGHILITFPSI